MSLYNMVNKVNPAAFFILPMLGNGHPDNWPRFRDCFATIHSFTLVDGIPRMLPIDEKEKPGGIYVLLRIGGNNRDPYLRPWYTIRGNPNYIEDWDDTFDRTFAHIHFNVPEKWRSDYDKVTIGDYKGTSPEYRELIYDTYPRLKDTFSILFNS